MTLSQDILKKMMELPNRASGTIFEEKAAAYLQSVYNYFGIQTKTIDSYTLKNSFNNHLIISFSLVLLTILVNFLNIAFLTIGVFIFALLVYFRLFNLPFRFFKRRSISKNIYAEIPAKGEEKYTLVITSHYDTGSDLGPLVSILGPMYTFLNSDKNGNLNIPDYVNNPLIFSNISIALTFLALFLPDSAAKLFFGFFAAIPLIIGIYFLQRGKNKFSSGAYNNGVGTALIVEMASIISKNPPQNTRVIFANIAAEETLTRGTLPLLNSLNLDKSKTFILDLDCIGEDRVTLINSEPSYPLGLAVPYDSTFEVLADFAEDYFQDDYKIINSPLPTDNQELVFAGYRVMGLITTMPETGYPNHYHSSKDTIDKIKWDKVEITRDFLFAYIVFFDSLTKEINL